MKHGVSEAMLDEALSVACKFFDLPTREKMKLMSNDVHKPVRCGTSLKDGIDKVQFWRVFLKHYAHPLKDWIHLWPQNPPDYRYKHECCIDLHLNTKLKDEWLSASFKEMTSNRLP